MATQFAAYAIDISICFPNAYENQIEMNDKSFLLFLSFLLLGPSFVRAQIQPTNVDEYDVEVRFYQAYGTIDLNEFLPDPMWQVAVANDDDGLPDPSLLNNAPNVVNDWTYCHTSPDMGQNGNRWHGVANVFLDTFLGNTTGKFDYEIMSYENDCTSWCIYNDCGDFDMRFVEGVLDFTTAPPGVATNTEIIVDNVNFRSKVRLRHIWKYTHGSRNSPLILGQIERCRGYGHTSSDIADEFTISYSNDWTESDHSNFNGIGDITYTFELTEDGLTQLTFLDDADQGRMHLVDLNSSGVYENYLGYLDSAGAIEMNLDAGEYALVVEGDLTSIQGFTIGVIQKCNTNDLILSGVLDTDLDYETNGAIISDQQLGTGNFSYDAGESIMFNPGFEVNTSSTFSAFVEGCGALVAGCGVTDIDGNYYQTVHLGNQEWIAENLRTSKYNNGDPIIFIGNDANGSTAWTNANYGAYCIYDTVGTGYPSFDANEFGFLYNWYAVNDGRGLCPTGWHVPSDSEWTTLIDYLDPESVNPNATGVQSYVAGGAMKEAGNTHWNDPNVGATNLSRFTGLPGGNRSYISGGFFSIGTVNFLWSSTVHTTTQARYRKQFAIDTRIERGFDNRKLGYSVRCIKD